MGSEKVLENFSRWSWKVLEKSWIFFQWKSGNPDTQDLATIWCVVFVAVLAIEAAEAMWREMEGADVDVSSALFCSVQSRPWKSQICASSHKHQGM